MSPLRRDMTRPLPLRQLDPSHAVREVSEKRKERLETPETCYSLLRHEQALDLFEPKARIARAMVIFDPWHGFVPEISVRHGTLPRVTPAIHRHAIPIGRRGWRTVR